jgi:hypothetical protein
MENSMSKEFMRCMELFVSAINAKDNLEIVCGVTPDDGSGDLVVVQNSALAEGIEGHQTEVETAEIFAKCSTESRAQNFADVVACEKNPIQLHGITRIVGYYSRVHNWNKSKVGELRERNQKHYALSGQTPEHDEARHAAINSL